MHYINNAQRSLPASTGCMRFYFAFVRHRLHLPNVSRVQLCASGRERTFKIWSISCSKSMLSSLSASSRTRCFRLFREKPYRRCAQLSVGNQHHHTGQLESHCMPGTVLHMLVARPP